MINGNNEYPWVNRIKNLLEERGESQKELASGIKSKPSTISAWLSPKTCQEPKIIGFHAVAQYFGVSMDYLYGDHEGRTQDNEEIHKTIALSDKSIRRLIQAKKLLNKGSVSVEKKIAMCNYLLENMDRLSFLEDLYDYLFGEFFFRGKDEKNPLGADFIISRSPSGKESQPIVFNSVFSNAYFSIVQSDLVRMKDSIDELREKQEEVEYRKWEEENKEEILQELFKAYEEAEKE